MFRRKCGSILRVVCFLLLSVLTAGASAHGQTPPPESALGRDLHVDPVRGDDSQDGGTHPVKSIQRAIGLARAGDTIHLSPGRYFESAVFSSKSGEAGRPIVLDGHGAIIDGSDPINPTEWDSLGDGLYRSTQVLPTFNPSIVSRWYFLFDGRMVRMGRSSKGPKDAWKTPADLQPGEWTTVEAEKAFYVRIAPDRELASAGIRIPRRSNAVGFGGRGGHLVIRNIVGTHVYNDGFNVHGHQLDCVFENITAIECGDDGFSAHEDAECRIDGFVSIGNSTGLCDIGESVTHYRNVFIRDCHGFDIYFLGETQHSMENVLVESSAAHALQVSQQSQRPDADPVRVQLKNLHIRRAGDKPAGRAYVSRNAKLTLERCTLQGVDLAAAEDSQIRVVQSVFAGEPLPRLDIRPGAIWLGEYNLYDVASWKHHDRDVTRATFGAFQQETASERNSQWEDVDELPSGVGADRAALQHLRSSP